MKYLMNQGWIRIRESLGKNKSRPTKVYELAKPITEILNCIEKEKKEMMNNQLSLVRKLRDYLK
jgi:predicted transcriptional regulator